MAARPLALIGLMLGGIAAGGGACTAPTAASCGDRFCPSRTSCADDGKCVVDIGACSKFEDGSECRRSDGTRGACLTGSCQDSGQAGSTSGGSGGASGGTAGSASGGTTGGSAGVGAAGGATGGSAGVGATGGSAGLGATGGVGGTAGTAGSGGSTSTACDSAVDGASCVLPSSATGMCSSGTCRTVTTFSGAIGRADAPVGVNGALVALRNHPGAPATSSGANGAYQISVPSIADVSLRIAKSGFVPSVTAPIDVATYGAVTSALPIAAVNYWLGFHSAAGVTRDTTKGSIVLVLDTKLGETDLSTAGALTGCAGPFYTDKGESLPDPQALGLLRGTAIWLNCAPGTYTLTASHPSLACARTAPVASPTLPVEVMAGSNTLAGTITCE